MALCRLSHSVNGVLHSQAGLNLGVQHIPVALHGSSTNLELSHYHQRPVGMKAPQPHSGMDAALHAPAEPSSQAQCRVGRSPALSPELNGKPPPAHHQDMNIATEEMNYPSIHEYPLW